MVGEYQPYREYCFTVFDCDECRCRYVWRDTGIYETFHSQSASPYAAHQEMGDIIEQYYRDKNLRAMEDFLSRWHKNRFVMDAIRGSGGSKRLLELGCSLGYLTAFHLLSGHDIIGVDLSATAVAEATRRFGPHFALVQDDCFDHLGSFDAIYHVGTIGCVDDPIQFTKALLKVLKPGGHLFFNAPNGRPCRQERTVWNCGTPPPDLITLFCDKFWHQYFDSLAKVQVTYEPYDHEANLLYYWNRLRRRPYLEAGPPESIHQVKARSSSPWGNALKRALSPLRPVLGYIDILPRHPLESGSFITMTKY